MTLPVFYQGWLYPGQINNTPLQIMLLCEPQNTPQDCAKLWKKLYTQKLALIYQHIFQNLLWKNLWRMWITPK